MTHRLRLTLAQVPIEEKSNEIPAFPKLLRDLPKVDDALVTADAMNCQQESARVTTQERGWDYLFGLKGNQSGVLERAERLLQKQAFPPDEAVSWEKDHWRLERRRLVRATVTPEEIGLCGCWQVIAVRRERESFDPRAEGPSDEIAYYATSIAQREISEADLLDVIRGHWSAIENGVHHRRDVSFGEDACRVADRSAAHALATLRNLAIGLYEIECSRDRLDANGLKSWCRRMTVAVALKLLRS